MSILSWLKKEITIIEGIAAPAVQVVEEKLPGLLISILEVFLAGVSAETPYPVILATAEKIAESTGLAIGKQAIQASVNKAENNLIVAGTPAPITIAAATKMTEATPLPDDSPAVVAAIALATATDSGSPVAAPAIVS